MITIAHLATNKAVKALSYYYFIPAPMTPDGIGALFF